MRVARDRNRLDVRPGEFDKQPWLDPVCRQRPAMRYGNFLANGETKPRALIAPVQSPPESFIEVRKLRLLYPSPPIA